MLKWVAKWGAKKAIKEAPKVWKAIKPYAKIAGTKSVLDVKNLASLPSLKELRTKLVGLLVAPANKIAGIVQRPAGQLLHILNSYTKETK